MDKRIATGLLILSAAVAGCSVNNLRLPDREPAIVARHADVIDQGAGAFQAGRAAEVIDEAFDLFSQVFGFTPGRVRVHVFADRAAYAAAGGEGDGLYQPGDAPAIVLHAPVRERVLRHEVAHHFVLRHLGRLPVWLNEGIAEYLETVQAVDGRPVISGFVPEHLEVVYTRTATGHALRDGHFHLDHHDYARAWSLVAFLLQRERGTLRERLESLKAYAGTSPAEIETALRKEWTLPDAWIAELERTLRGREGGLRIAAARVLGRIGRLDALRAAARTEPMFPVRLVIATELAVAGERAPLRELLAGAECLHNLGAISRSAGREFGSIDDVRAWLGAE